jgi:Amt family ammonium transporter
MKGTNKEEKKLSLSTKLSRLGERLRDPQWRRYGLVLYAGKMLGIAAIFFVMVGVPFVIHESGKVTGTSAFAEDKPADAKPADAKPADAKPADAKPADAAATPPAPPPLKADDIVNPLNTVWVLVAAFLVFGMQVGFTMLEAGFCRSRETVNVLVECVFDTCLCGIFFWAFGFAFMFGHGNGLIGWGDGQGKNWFFLNNIPATYEGTGIAFLAVWLFQFAFADCASTICSGAMVGRTSFIGDILYSCGVSGFIYPIIGHWAWGPDGFLATMGGDGMFLAGTIKTSFHDFAGSTVVHTIGGAIALCGAIVLGPRLGRKFKRDGGAPMLPHDLTIAVCGGLFLWFGWYGFNPGSTLSAMDMAGIGRVAANTTLAACAGGLTAVFYLYFKFGKWDAGAITNGLLAGLVAITCPCYWVSPAGAVALGAIAGVLALLATEALEYLRIDDPIGAVPVHFVNGIWGTISLGIFACGQYGATGPTGADNSAPLAGLLYGGGTTVLMAQIVGSAIITCATLAVGFALMYAVNATGHLRVTKEQELFGLDLAEHGISAYPEYVITASGSPTGMPPDAAASSVLVTSGEKVSATSH